MIALAPTGYAVSVSLHPQFREDGTIKRTWTAMSGRDGWYVADTRATGLYGRVRFTHADKIFYEDGLPGSSGWRPSQADANTAMLGALGDPDPTLAWYTLLDLAESGPGRDEATYKVLWGGSIETPDMSRFATTGTLDGDLGVHKAVVAAVITRDGGGTYLVKVDNGDGTMTTLATGVLGAPQRSLVSWRDQRAHDRNGPPSRLPLYVLAPASAARVEFAPTHGSPVSAPVADGLATLTTAYPARGTINAYDAQGQPVAQRSLAEPRPVYDVEPPIVGWK